MALTPTGFWSYTSGDDAASGGRLSQLRRLLANRLQQQVGRQQVHLFQDVETIPPGTQWEKRIEAALDEASFFVPIVTPGFLHSEWCAREVKSFRTKMRARGRDDLIVPIHYLDVDAFETVRRAECADPEVFRYLRTLQWVDFRDLEPLDPGAAEVRVGLGRVAKAIVDALYREVPVPTPRPAPQTLRPTATTQGTPASGTVGAVSPKEASRKGDDAYYGRKDYAEAMRWYRMAADQGDAEGQFGVGKLYHWGDGVRQDYAEAMRWHRKAADQGNSSSYFSIGLMYMEGQGVAKDFAEALRWFMKCSMADSTILLKIGELYAEGGPGLQKDLAQARQWMQKSAAAGHPTAKRWLAEH
ncbi:MAG: toll/interleukin-1 receptor domain-containing protein [Acetobacteraceae bacterium]